MSSNMHTIPLHVPELHGNEWKYLKDCLDTGWVSSVGSYVERFERMTADYVGTEHAVATVNGTAALHIALLVAGVQPDDEVLVSTLTFIAPVNVIRYVGAWPVFVDAEPDYWQMDVTKVEQFLVQNCQFNNGELRNKSTGRRVRAILPVHILGHPVDIDPLLAFARKYELVVVEDAAESLGAKYKGRSVGCLGHIGCFSFNGNKIITTGGGGMIVTDNEALARKARYLTTQAKDDPVEYIHNNIGYNYRLTNVQAAMGCAQMEQLDNFIGAKRRVAAAYDQQLAGLDGITTPKEAPWAKTIFWLYTVLVDKERFGIGPLDLVNRLQSSGIEARLLWRPAHRQQPYQREQAYRVEVADRLYDKALSLPSSAGISDIEIERVVHVICDAKRSG